MHAKSSRWHALAWIGLTVVLSGVAVGASRSRSSLRLPKAPLPDFGVVPDFSLTDQHGMPFASSALDGHIWIADFIFTRCRGQCPLMSERMVRLQGVFGDEPAIRFVSFSVDPAYDTPEVLSGYAKHWGADVARWRFVTGEAAELTHLAQEGFHLSVSEDGTADEPITHSVRLVLVDHQRRIRGYYDATEPQAMGRLVSDARRLIQEGS